MRNPTLLIVLVTSYMLSCSPDKRNEADQNHPNIVLILADDMGYGDVSCYNPQSKIQTPNMDRIASEGILFTDAHATSSVCTPSRYSLLTGRYCWRTRLKKGVILGYDEAPLIEAGQLTIAGMLKEQGYETACVGKWHLGMTWQTKEGYVIQDDQNDWQGNAGVYQENEKHIDFEKPLLSGPLEVGFDYFFGTQGCSTGDPPYCFIENRNTVGIPSIPPPDSFLAHPGVAPGLMVADWDQETVDVTFTRKAIAFIEKNQSLTSPKPFFLYLALSSPHIPFLPPDFAKGQSEEGPRGDLVTVVDWSVGQVSQALKDLGINAQTLLIVSSDNGPRKGANGHLSAGKFRGFKASIWEGGHRIPFIASWPGHIKPGTTSTQTISFTDLLPTLSFLVQGANPLTDTEDGYAVWPAFLGGEVSNKEELIRVFHSVSGIFAVQQGPWKLILGTKGGGTGQLTESPDSIHSMGQLYNIQSDPYETKDLWDQEPEIVEQLTGLLLEKTKESL